MDHYKYIIIGGGMTGDAAVKGIREIDKDGSIAMISLEAHPPYSRPPLTKGLWKNTLEEKIWKKTEDQNVNLILNSKAERIENVFRVGKIKAPVGVEEIRPGAVKVCLITFMRSFYFLKPSLSGD